MFEKTKLEPEVLLCTVVMFQKILQLYKITRYTLKPILSTIIMIQSKLNDDRGMKLPSFARHSGIPVDNLMKMEWELCQVLDWKIYVRLREYQEIFDKIINEE
ncbi:Cyclin [Hexamita inflata]|uniref:Cyclin n=1 Tax=Hexamita inflata TaxID=28002 RepID=A0AA86QU03_9EUKA|nr:Cyclin [Hexamita inflata]